jgi:hypothetical protein
MLWENAAALAGERVLVETRAMARRLPSFQWLAARGACDGQGSEPPQAQPVDRHHHSTAGCCG